MSTQLRMHGLRQLLTLQRPGVASRSTRAALFVPTQTRGVASMVLNARGSFVGQPAQALEESWEIQSKPTSATWWRGAKNKGKGKGKGKSKAKVVTEDAEEPENDETAELDMDKANKKMDRVLEAFKGELGKLRTGRPDPAMLDHLKVEAYGDMVSFSSVAHSSLKTPKQLVVSLFDPTLLEKVRHTIETSGLGLNPAVQGDTISIPIPKTTKASRDASVKKAKDLKEKTRISVNNIRRDLMKNIADFKKKKLVSEDEARKLSTVVDEFIEKAHEDVATLCDSREREIMDV